MQTELAGPREVGPRVVRRGAILIGAALLAATVGYVISAAGTDTWEATAKVAFIEDTRFDYLDAERDRLVGLVEGQAQELRSQSDVHDIIFDRPDRETFIDVVVTSTEPSLSRDVANELAELTVESDRSVRLVPIERELAARTIQLPEIDSRITALELEMQLETEREAFAEANRYEGDAEQLERLTIQLRDAQDSFFLATRFRNRLDVDRAETEQRIVQLELDRDLIDAELRVVRPALLPEEPAGMSSSSVAVIVGISTLALGAIVLAIRPRPHGLTEPAAKGE
jgi:hypothetical protein